MSVPIEFYPPITFSEITAPMSGVPIEVCEAFADMDVTSVAGLSDALGMAEPGPLVLFALRCGATLREAS